MSRFVRYGAVEDICCLQTTVKASLVNRMFEIAVGRALMPSKIRKLPVKAALFIFWTLQQHAQKISDAQPEIKPKLKKFSAIR